MSPRRSTPLPSARPAAAEALLAGAAIDFRSGALSRGVRARRGRAATSPRRSATRTTNGALSSSSASSGSQATRSTSRCAGSSVRWHSPAVNASRPRRRSASTRSASPSWILGDLPSADRLLAESIERFRALEGSPDTIPSPLNIAEIRTSQSDGRSGLRHVFEDTLQPLARDLLRHRRQLRARESGGHRARPGRCRPGARAARGERCAVSRRRATTRGRATVLVRRAYISLAEGDSRPPRAVTSRRALELRASLNDRRGLGLAPVGPRPDRHDRRRLRRLPSGISPRPAISSGAPATAGGSRARCGASPTSPSRAAASTTPRPRSRRRTRC